MSRLPALVVLFAFPLAGWAAPVPKALKKKGVPAVVGTTWVSNDQAEHIGVIEYTFAAGGALEYRYVKSGASFSNGTWRQDGAALYWEVNTRYAEFNLTFADGGFTGTAHNVAGKNWDVAITAKEEK